MFYVFMKTHNNTDTPEIRRFQGVSLHLILSCARQIRAKFGQIFIPYRTKSARRSYESWDARRGILYRTKSARRSYELLAARRGIPYQIKSRFYTVCSPASCSTSLTLSPEHIATSSIVSFPIFSIL